MYKLSVCFVALLAGIQVSSAIPVMEARQFGPPEAGNICRPVGINTTVQYFLQSMSIQNSVWQAEQLNNNSFIAVNLANKTNASAGSQGLNNQLWSVVPVNNGNSFAIVSDGPIVSNASVCVNGDGGPVDSIGCPDVFSGEAPQSAQFFITCQTCATDNLGATGCQIQSANEGQCASFLQIDGNVIELDDCSSGQPNQFWNIVADSTGSAAAY